MANHKRRPQIDNIPTFSGEISERPLLVFMAGVAGAISSAEVLFAAVQFEAEFVLQEDAYAAALARKKTSKPIDASRVRREFFYYGCTSPGRW